MCEQDKMPRQLKQHEIVGAKVCIPIHTFLEEHERLDDVLRHAKRDVQVKEAAKQAEEVKMLLRHPEDKPHLMLARPEGMKRHAEGAPLIHQYKKLHGATKD